MRSIPGGIYAIGPIMLADTKSGLFGKHVCNVGCQIAADLGRELAIPALTVDPPACDEFCAWARYSGVPQIERRSSYHALNQKATARKLAKDM